MPKHRRFPRVASGAPRRREGARELTTQVTRLRQGLAALSLAVVPTLGAAAWACIGTAASAFIPNAEAAWPLLGATYLPTVLLSGSFGAVAREPGWLASLMRYLPAQPIIEGAQRALHGAPFPALTPRDVAVLAAWIVAGFLVSQRFFRWR